MDLSLWFVIIIAVILYGFVLIDQHGKKDRKTPENTQQYSDTKTMEFPIYNDRN